MNRRDFYHKLAEVQGQSTVTVEAPLPLVVSAHDGLAARLLLWLVDQMPAEATEGDMDDVLDAARWWHTFLGSLQYAEKLQREKEQT